jgi:hypothetical protein
LAPLWVSVAGWPGLRPDGQTTVFEFLGIAGISIGVLAYMPQVVHLWREHCSAGVSARAWAMWLTSSLLTRP